MLRAAMVSVSTGQAQDGAPEPDETDRFIVTTSLEHRSRQEGAEHMGKVIGI